MRKLLGPVAALALLFMLAVPAMAAPSEKFHICHATSSEGNPFVSIKVPAGSSFAPHLSDNEGNSPLAGHEQDFLLEGSGLDACDDVLDEATPVAPSVTPPTCDAPGMLTLDETNGITYTVDPEYNAGDTGDFTVTASADQGFFIPEGAETEFEVNVPAQLDCPENAIAVAPSVSAATCAAPGALTLTPATGVTYVVTPAYTAGASGAFKVTASAAAGFTLSGQSVFDVNVPAKLVCNSGTLAGNPPSTPPAAQVPNTAMDFAADQTPVLLAVLAIAGLAILGRRNIKEMMDRR
jgi:hypothetical protein